MGGPSRAEVAGPVGGVWILCQLSSFNCDYRLWLQLYELEVAKSLSER